MQTYAIIAVKHGLECKVKEAAGQEAALHYAQRYHQRNGLAVRVYSPTMERIWSAESRPLGEKTMPVVTIERPRTLCPPGPQTFVLADVTPQMMPSFDGTGEVERWIWRFVGSQKDEEGQFYEVSIFTGQSYGNSRAKLTWLLDMLRPGITKKQADQLDTDSLLGTHYEGMVKHEQAIRDPEKKIATFSYLKPLGNEGAPDPFAFDQDGAVESCDVCGEELTDLEIRTSRKHWADVLLCTRHGRERRVADKVAAGALAAT